MAKDTRIEGQNPFWKGAQTSPEAGQQAQSDIGDG